MPIYRSLMGVARDSAAPGALSGTTTIATGSSPRSICISADGASVYATNSISNTVSIFTRNTTTGALSGTTTIATGANPYGVCISANGASVYAANNGGNTVSIFTRS